eukprot:1042795-Karenia_brevis.AAC.1
MSLLPCGPWWSDKSLDQLHDTTVSRQFRSFIGMDDCYTVADPFVVWLSEFAHFDAKTAFRNITGDGVILETPPLPSLVEGRPPQTANAFSDGSLTNPRQPNFGLASAAVWWPGRTKDVTDLEYQFSLSEAVDGGLAIMGFLGGYRSSSSRVELLGVILALLSDLPVFLAVDNASVVRRAHFYHKWLLQNPNSAPPGKPFSLLKN